MLAIAIRFNANRFHATQWGRHVNEGVPEWPPSPWRILRALVSVWKRTKPELSDTIVVPILECLAAEPPHFYLPDAAQAHTRHYMPWEKKGPDDHTLVIDSFLAIQSGCSAVATWPNADLTPDRRAILSALLANLGYLGRAESWCEAFLVESPLQANCFPLEGGAMPAGDWEIVRVLVPRAPLRFKGLCVDTSELRGQGMIDPPGAQWLPYIRRADCFSARHARSGAQAIGPQPTVFRYALAGPSGEGPLVTDTLRIAELARQTVMAQYGRANAGTASPVLSGKAPDGTLLQGHGHAFFLPTDENDDGRIDHLTVWAPDGLGQQELQALANASAMNPGSGRPELRLAFLAYGDSEDFRDSAPIFRTAQVWRTATPFVLNRHVKLRGVSGDKHLADGPEDQVRKELERRPQIGGHVDSIALACAPKIQGWRRVYPLEFYRWRRNGPQSGNAFNFHLRFTEPVGGPIALGYACHFGLGLFVPAPAAEGG